jgi:hypothetical protein
VWVESRSERTVPPVTYIGIDPGAVYTGIAVYENGTWLEWHEYTDPVDVWQVIRKFPYATVILENFIGSGRLNNYRKKTIMVLGYVYYRCREYGVMTALVTPQKRKAYVSEVPAEIIGKDEIAAAAHVLAYIAR